MRADIRISLGDEGSLSCLGVAHDDLAPRPSDGPLTCASQRSRYLGVLLGLNKYERRLISLLGMWPRWRVRRGRVAALLTALTTESNREIAMTVLEDELCRIGTSSRGV